VAVYTTWGGQVGSNLQNIGLQFIHEDPAVGTTHIACALVIYTAAAYSTSDDQIMYASGTGLGAPAWGYRMSQGQHAIARIEFGSQDLRVVGGQTWSWSASVGGHYGGVTPAHSLSYTLPTYRAATTVPGQPSTAVDTIYETSARAVVGAPASNGGLGIDRYRVRIQKNAGGAIVYDQETSGTVTVSGLTHATDYVFFAGAHNANGWGPWSAARGFKTLTRIPFAPTGLAATGATNDSVTLRFTPPADNGGEAITRYAAQVSRNAAFTDLAAEVSSIGSGQAITGLDPGTDFWVRVRAWNAKGAGAWSNVATFKTLAAVFVKHEGAWRNARPFVKVNGVWSPARAWKKDGGAWRL
jgi:hypothetical protein